MKTLLTTIELDECGSTNDEAWKHAPRPTLVLARRQTKGRGRQGRRWENGPADGNLLASLAMPAPERNLSWLPLAAGVAAVRAAIRCCELTGYVRFEPLRLKWPNDILWNDAKLGGLLCESRVVGERASAVVAGFGLNLASAPALDGVKTASLAEHAGDRAAELGSFLAHEWAMGLLAWTAELSANRTDGLRAAWLGGAKLSSFPDFSVHDRAGQLVRLRALDLDENGKLRAAVAGSDTKIVVLDQPDTI